MENATKRIRKARRQGLQTRGVGRTRAPVNAPTRNTDLMGAPKPNRARKTRITQRKAKRQARSPAAKR